MTARRPHVAPIRLSVSEHATLSARAQAAGLPLSTYLRQAALDHEARPCARCGGSGVDPTVED